MSPRATVLIPTFVHGPTLRYSVASVLQQTVEDFELFVVGDGTSDVTRDIMRNLTSADPRVRFFDNAKGPRHGEIHRASALAEASGDIVCYQADDDLWTPFHLEAMLEWLADADFAHTLPLRVEPDQTLAGWTINLEDPGDRELLLSGENRIPLACSGHALAAYRRLPYGWRTTPPDIPTDLYMFQQFLADPAIRAVSGTQPTCLHFASPQRADWPIEKRCAELDKWFLRVSDRDWSRNVLPELALVVESRNWAAVESELRATRQTIAALTGKVQELAQEKQTADEELDQLRQTIHSSVTWRLRQRLLRLPVLAGIVRWAARMLAGREGS